VFQKTGSEQVILDGFPRKVEQAEWLYENQSTYGYTIDLAVVIDVSEEEVVKRMSARGRADDSPEAVAERLRIYHQENEPILTFLEQKDIPIARVNGVGQIGLIHETINEEVDLVLE
jgi:adenylate kinase